MVSYRKAVKEAGQGNHVALLLLSLCTKIKVKSLGAIAAALINAFNSLAASVRIFVTVSLSFETSVIQ